ATKTSSESVSTIPNGAPERLRKKRQLRFPTAFTVLFFVLLLVWGLTFVIKPGSYAYVSCEGGAPKPIPSSYQTAKSDLSLRDRLYDLLLAPVNGLYGIRTPSDVVKAANQACGTVDGQQVPAQVMTAAGATGPYNVGDLAGAAGVFFFVLAIGAFITVTLKTGALEAGIAMVTDRFRTRGLLLIAILMVVFSIGG